MKIQIIGAGPAGLMAAEKLAQSGHEIHVYESTKRVGSKFLVAGKGGFNLSNSIQKEELLKKYSHERIAEMVDAFDADNTRTWLESINIPSYIGSSGKIFPMVGIKPVDVLNNWMRKLEELNVQFHYDHELIDFDASELTFKVNDAKVNVKYDKAIFAFGGGSWKKTGSTGSWMSLFEFNEITCVPFAPMNVGIEINWEEGMSKFEGQPLKNISVSVKGKTEIGELRITSYGLEGSPVYALSPEIIEEKEISIDLKPNLSLDQVVQKLRGPKMNRNLIDRLSFSKPMMQLIRSYTDKETYLNPQTLAESIKGLKLSISDIRPIDEAISTQGGVSFDAINNDLSIKNFPKIHCVGEMLDWHAPTGGYLLQGCFSSGVFVASKISFNER